MSVDKASDIDSDWTEPPWLNSVAAHYSEECYASFRCTLSTACDNSTVPLLRVSNLR